LSKDYQNIKNLPLKLAIKIIIHRHEEQEELKAWDMWLVQYQHMDKDTFKPFSQFLEDLKPKQISTRSVDEILEEARNIRKSLGKEW
jgi:hypothetical protein